MEGVRFGAGQRAAPRALRTAQADRRRRATGVADREVEQGRATGGGAAVGARRTGALAGRRRRERPGGAWARLAYARAAGAGRTELATGPCTDTMLPPVVTSVCALPSKK